MSLIKPPRPRCALRVAVIGHRWDLLAPEHGNLVRGRVEEILRAIGRVASDVAVTPRAGFDGNAPVLTLLSGLAEGTDRLAADAALRTRGWRVHAVAPFALALYEQDFGVGNSAAEFHRLWQSANARTVLDGRVGEFDAYDPLARTLIDFSDILITVWNGTAGRGVGGTAASVAAA